MSTDLGFVGAAEAAFIGDVTTVQMNRLMDEELVPSTHLRRLDGVRRFSRLSAAFAKFFFDTEDVLVASARKHVFAELTARVEKLHRRDQVFALRLISEDVDWKVHAATGVDADLSYVIILAAARALAVDTADELVKADPEVMSGEPCFAGTRVPIDNVLASLDKGIPKKRIVESYPFLTDAHIDSARIYRQVHPRRGRPRRASDSGSTIPRRQTRVVRPARG